MSRKLLLDPYLAIHGKIMAKNGHFFMEFWPIFDIFHGLRPYLCSKAQDLGFHKQPTHRRRGDEPFFYSGVDRSWLGMAQKWSILDQKWPNMAGLSTLQRGPKGSKRDQNGQPKSFWTFGTPFGPIWTLLDHFKQELIFCSEAPLQNPILSIWGKEIIFVWNGPKGSRWTQTGSQMIKKT